MEHRNKQDSDDWMRVWGQGQADGTDSDDEDEGGDDVLSQHTEKSQLRVRRSFELLLKSGQVVRFEVRQLSSCESFVWNRLVRPTPAELL